MNTNAMIQVTVRDLGITFSSHSSRLTCLCRVTWIQALEINRCWCSYCIIYTLSNIHPTSHIISVTNLTTTQT